MYGGKLASFFVGGILWFALLCDGAELDDAGARAAAVAALRASDPEIGPQCLKTRRMESFEESLLALRRNIVRDGQIAEDVLVYEVVSEGCYSVEGGSLIVQVVDHPGTFGYVAVNRTSGKAYRLWMGGEAGSDFSRLASDLGLATNDENRAVSAGILYRGLTLGPHGGAIAYDRFQVKQLAERSFYRAFPEDHWATRFDRWWKRFPAGQAVRFDVSAKAAPGGWIVTGKEFRGFVLTVPRTRISGHPAVYEWSLLVSRDGTVTELPRRVVFE